MDSGRQQNPKQEAGAVISFGPRRLSLFEHFVTISPVCNNIRIVMEIGEIGDRYAYQHRNPGLGRSAK